MKVLIEMTEQEFEDYKSFLNGDYVKKEDYVEVPLSDILKQKGFKVTHTEYHFDTIYRKNVAVAIFKKDGVEVTIQGYEDSF